MIPIILNKKENYFMKLKGLLAVGAICLMTAGWSAPVNEVWTRIVALKDAGEFSQCSAYVNEVMASPAYKNYPKSEQDRIVFQIDLLNRIKRDFRLDEQMMWDQLTAVMPDLSKIEFEGLVNSRMLDWKLIDGQKRFFSSSRANLFIRYPDWAKRANKYNSEDGEILKWSYYLKARDEHDKTGKSYVAPQKYKMTMTLTVKPDEAPDGAVVKCWMPFPREVAHQSDIKFLSSNVPLIKLSDGKAWQRTAYFERQAVAGQTTEFQMSYEFTAWGRYNPMSPDKVKPYKKDSEYSKWTQEKYPHVYFSPLVKEISPSIVGQETNPLKKAQLIYNWIAKNTKYSYAHEYSTMPNITDFVLTRRYGDCGQHGMTFITLCRYNGIPARWQSGWSLKPNQENLHDWAEYYVEPYGWIPCDPDAGVWIAHSQYLSEEQKDILLNFYFQGVDHYRLTCNNDHGVDFDPVKKSHRSDDVDSQRGEIEVNGQNLYYPQWGYNMLVERL